MTLGKKFNQSKERINMALKHSSVWSGEDENGESIYEVTTKDEVIKEVLHLFDETVYECLNASTSGRALERMLHD